MAAAKKRTSRNDEEFIPMAKTRALLTELWGHWRVTLGHTPDKAKRMIDAAVKELHRTENKVARKIPSKKTAVKKVVKAVAKSAVKAKAKSVKAKIVKKARKLKA